MVGLGTWLKKKKGGGGGGGIRLLASLPCYLY